MIRTPRFACAALVSVFVSGCSFVPEYFRPVAPVPADWPQGAAVPPAPTFPADWRSYFTDPQLQPLIEAALEHNRDLRIAVARVAEARALAGIVHAERFPAVDVNAGQQAAKVPGDLNASGDPLITRRFDANFGISSFELDFWGRVKSLDAAAQANFLATEYAQRAFRLSLIADVAQAYYSWTELEMRYGIAAETQRARSETRDLMEKRRDVGLTTDIDYLAADGAFQNARAEVAALARQRVAALNALRLLVGDEIAVPPAPTFVALPEIAAGLPSEVLLNRPDVLAAEQRLIAANANIGAARAAYFPRITLTLLAGTASPALAGLFGSGSGAWSFVPLLKLPIFDAGRSESTEAVTLARREMAVAEYEKAIQQAFREVADLLAARTYYVEQVDALAAAEKAHGERLQKVRARYQMGVSNYLELLDAQRDYFLAQQFAVAARRGQVATSAALFKALGGA